MRERIDMVGKKFGRLYVITKDTNWPGPKTKWVCRCDCGRVTSVIGEVLRRGDTKSCGCLRRERSRQTIAKQNPRQNPRKAGSGICYNVWCPSRDNYKGAWSCRKCRDCAGRVFSRKSARQPYMIKKEDKDNGSNYGPVCSGV